MNKRQKINRLTIYCCNREDCNNCLIYDECSGSFEDETTENIDEMYRKITESSITDNLIVVSKERQKAITEIFEEIKSSICDSYCKYTNEITDYDEMLETKCTKCPLNKL